MNADVLVQPGNYAGIVSEVGRIGKDPKVGQGRLSFAFGIPPGNAGVRLLALVSKLERKTTRRGEEDDHASLFFLHFSRPCVVLVFAFASTAECARWVLGKIVHLRY